MKKPKTTYLKDYQAPSYTIPKINLDIEFIEDHAIVKSTFTLIPNDKSPQAPPISLNGETLELLSVKKNGQSLNANEYTLTETQLCFPPENTPITLEITTKIEPHKNLALEGIYQSGNIICSQNEPEGFRRITYFIDRPDIMSVFTTRLTADKTRYPYLLSNGNPQKKEILDNNRHAITWEDPFPKPAYLFAVVAGDLAKKTDHFVTKSGKKITLEIYVDHGNESKCDHAMTSLKKSMKWDEDRFNLEYDLNLFMIVAVDAFNMGAMENKGLNIFNTHYVLANPKTATDQDFMGIEAVIGHEYFHNWTGNRITCRDWFQLTLKEGLTVFRDQEFSSDLNDRTIERLKNVQRLRHHQFAEDASPMAHPIRPESFIEINNFYTSTVYEKGSEIIRMIHTLIGEKSFQKGMALYVKKHDGQAVTTEDFLAVMEEASGHDLTAFKRWYCQAGTPVCTVTDHYNEITQTYELNVTQNCRPTKESKQKAPFYFPFSVGLLSKTGEVLANETLIIKEESQSFSFKNIKSKPIPSLNQDFSAPVNVIYPYEEKELCQLLNQAPNAFNQIEASQELYYRSIQNRYEGNTETLSSYALNALGQELEKSANPSITVEKLSIPSLQLIINKQSTPIDIQGLSEARESIFMTLANTHGPLFYKHYKALNVSEPYTLSPEAISKRRLKNICLYYCVHLGCDYIDLAYTQFKTATNMTDKIAALNALLTTNSSECDAALTTFYDEFKDDPLVMNKWFTLQMSANTPKVKTKLIELAQNPAFNAENPNKIRALYGSFAANLPHFHAKDGSGYTLLANAITDIDTFNPSMGSRLANAYKLYPQLEKHYQALIKQELEKLHQTEGLSKNTFEVVETILNG